jgi:hypothetical protein
MDKREAGRVTIILAALMLATSPAMAADWSGFYGYLTSTVDGSTLPRVPEGGPYGEPAVEHDTSARAIVATEVPSANRPTCLGLLKALDAIVKLSEPANFMTHVVDQKRVDDMAKTNGALADKTLAQCAEELRAR